MRTILVGVALWALPFAALVSWRGWSSLHAQEYLFFTQAALVTFGGAYAVLAYVTQAAVGTYGWLSQSQAVDGLALAETTPGPLIMVLQFIGFMAGWNQPQGLTPTLSGIIGALVTTYTTFLPCFFFIFLGAPYIEVLRGNKASDRRAHGHHGRGGRCDSESRAGLRRGGDLAARIGGRNELVRRHHERRRFLRPLSVQGRCAVGCAWRRFDRTGASIGWVMWRLHSRKV